MSELTTNQLIKIVLGIFVVVFIIVALALLFYPKILSFFGNLPGSSDSSSNSVINNSQSNLSNFSTPPASVGAQTNPSNTNPPSSQKPQINLIPLNIKP